MLKEPRITLLKIRIFDCLISTGIVLFWYLPGSQKEHSENPELFE
jgi:hypothetical protein